MWKTSAFCIAILVVLASSVSFAQVQLYHSQAGFEAATGATALAFPATATALPNKPYPASTDYSCGPVPPGIDLPWASETPVANVQPPHATGSQDCLIWFIGPEWNGGAAPPSPMIVANGEDDYRITFAKPVQAVGFELFTNPTAIETVTLTFSDGSVAVFADTDLETAPSSFPFVGFKSLKPISAIDIDTTDGAVKDEGILAVKVAERYKIQIDIKPGSEPNSVNLGSNGKLPVAILSSPQFDATKIDPASISLAGAPVALRGKDVPMTSSVDVNGDGLEDLFVHIVTDALNLTADDTIAVMTATTSDGAAVYGEDSVRIVPPKK